LFDSVDIDIGFKVLLELSLIVVCKTQLDAWSQRRLDKFII